MRLPNKVTTWEEPRIIFFWLLIFPLPLQLLSNRVNGADILRLIPQTTVLLRALTLLPPKMHKIPVQFKGRAIGWDVLHVFVSVPSSTCCLVQHSACFFLHKSQNLSDNREFCLTSQPNQLHSRHASPHLKENSDPYLPLKGQGSMEVENTNI